jgi:hypothetical protein
MAKRTTLQPWTTRFTILQVPPEQPGQLDQLLRSGPGTWLQRLARVGCWKLHGLRIVSPNGLGPDHSRDRKFALTLVVVLNTAAVGFLQDCSATTRLQPTL